MDSFISNLKDLEKSSSIFNASIPKTLATYRAWGSIFLNWACYILCPYN